MLTTTLTQIGMNEKQAKIYLACLELGRTTIKEIAKKANVKRTTIYDIIEEMINTGYIRVTTRGKKKVFIATEPNDLQNILEKRQALLSHVLPQLNSMSNVSQARPKIWFYEGVDGLREAYENSLEKKNTTMYGWASEDVLDVLGDEWADNYIKRRVKRNIDAMIIMPTTQKLERFFKADKEHKRKSKSIDPKKYPFNIEINIYDNRVALMSARDRVGAIIESEPIANTMKMIFMLCWDNLKK